MFLDLIVSNLFAMPIVTFIAGIGMAMLKNTLRIPETLQSILAVSLLFFIGVKGGVAFCEGCSPKILLLLSVLIVWGFVQPFFSYAIVKKYLRADSATAAAIAACFGSVSVMTYAAGSSFLDKLGIPYQGAVVTALALMEVPAILSGIFLFNTSRPSSEKKKRLPWKEALLNKTVFAIGAGMAFGFFCRKFHADFLSILLPCFKPLLWIFLWNMGIIIGCNRKTLSNFSGAFFLFGVCMPIVGAIFGIGLGRCFGLDVGTGMLIAVLTASASYIAVPAAMRMAVPEAKEAIYLPLSLGVAFPFNIIVGVPMYYYFAKRFLL